MRKLIITTVAAAALAGGLGGTTARAAPGPPASCTSGTTSYVTHWRQPGDASVWFVKGTAGRSHPVGCMQIRPKVESNQQHQAGNGSRYTGGWITSQLPTVSTAKVPIAGDGSGVYEAWEQRQWVGGTHRQQREIYPVPGKWSNATAPAIRTTALARRCTPQWDWDWHRSSHPEYVRVDLEPPLCTGPSYQVQAKGLCATTGGGTYTTTSNVGRASEDEKYAACNHIHPLTDTLQYCYVRIGKVGGAWGAWRTVCIPIGTMDGRRR